MAGRWVLCFELEVAPGCEGPPPLCVVVADDGRTPTWPDRLSARRTARGLGLEGARPLRLPKGARLCGPTPYTPALSLAAAGGEILTRRLA